MAQCQYCGCEATEPGPKGKPRSPEQLRRYYVMIRAAYHHWPETHKTQFSSQTDCRKMLQMMAGYREVKSRTTLRGINPDAALFLATAVLSSKGNYDRPILHGEDLVVWTPRSIAYVNMGHEEFCKLNDDVASVIEAETGLKVDELMKETERAA